MNNSVNLTDLIQNGGVYYGIKGKNFETVYDNISKIVSLPAELTAETFYTELCAREELMSTAVGKGISIPHPRLPLLKNDESQRIFVCFLEKTLDVPSPDARPVFALFIVLSSNKQTHLSVLSSLAFLFQKDSFIKLLNTKPQKQVLFDEIKKHLV